MSGYSPECTQRIARPSCVSPARTSGVPSCIAGSANASATVNGGSVPSESTCRRYQPGDAASPKTANRVTNRRWCGAPPRPIFRAMADVIVIGGGIVGCTAALFLAEAGADVLLLESDEIAAAASGRNAGSIQHPLDEARAELYT